MGQQVAQEYIEYTKGKAAMDGKLKAIDPRSRHAPRPWLANTFDLMPTVVCQARNERARDAFRRQRDAKNLFMAHLRKTYGHELRALRRVLDPDRSCSFTRQNLRRYIGKESLG